MSRIALVTASLVACLALTSCDSDPSAQPGQASLETNVMTGTVTTYLDANLDRSFAAAKSAVESLQFRPVRDAKDALTGIVTAQTADGKDVSIELKKTSDAITQMKVNAGTLNTDIAKAVAAKVQERTR